MQFRWFMMVAAACMTVVSNPAGADMSETERITVSAGGVGAVSMRDISFADFVYNGSQDADSFEIEFVRTVTTDDREEFERLAGELSLVTDMSGDRLTIRLDHPRQTSRGFFDRIFDRAEWRVSITITGPADIDFDLDSEFSEGRISGTAGILRMDADFTDLEITSHTGRLEGSVDFGRLDTELLDGSFDVSSSFGGMDVQVARLRDDSRATASFGAVTIRIPDDVGADVYVDKSFSGIDFNTSRSVSRSSDRHRIIGAGGNRIDLSASFGAITVSDYEAPDRAAWPVPEAEGQFPLAEGMEWEFRYGSRSFTISVESYARIGGNPTVVLKGEGRDAPFQWIALFQNQAGLILTGVDGVFFGRDLSSARFDPPKFWLPYDTSVTIRDTLLGRITVERRGGVLEYEITTPGGDRHRIDISPETGFTRFDAFRLVETSAPEPERTELPPPPPRFSRGEVRSLDVRLRGNGLLDDDEITERLGISTGSVYSREEIDTAVEALEDDRFVDSAYFRVSSDGDLTVTVYQRDILDTDHGLDLSFSRVGGVGVGPRLTITSLVGPFSELSGGAEYHFANEEWTYDITGEKRLFDPAHQLVIGGGYRDAYESTVDWAISGNEASANAFIVGLENRHLYEVRGATAFIGFDVHDMLSLRATWFDEDYSSLKKHTNWSLFNAGHTKADNMPLPASFETRYTGIRYRASYLFRSGYARSRIMVEAEHGDPENSGLPESYTRWLGNAEFLWRFRWDNMVRLRIAGGYSNDDLPPQRAFRLGGLNTLRGYDFESIPAIDPRAGQFGFLYGGDRMLLLNWDYVYGLGDDVGIALFADAGNVWLNDAEFDVKELKRDVGISLIFGRMQGFSMFGSDDELDGLRINWAVPAGNVSHVSHWTVNFTSMF